MAASSLQARVEGAVMLTIPAVAVTLAAAVLVGPGGARPAAFARVYGAPSGDRIAVRILTATTLWGVEEPVAVSDLAVVERQPAGDVVRWRGRSDEGGAAEAWFTAEGCAGATCAPPALELRITGRGKVLARGAVDRSAPRGPILEEPRWLPGNARGELVVRARLEHALAAASSFPAAVLVDVRDDDGPVRGATVKIDAPGIQAVAAAPETDAAGQARFAVTPLAHVVDLVVDASTGMRSGHFEAPFPVIPGAIGVTRDARGVHVVAASPRDVAFVSFWGPRGRLGGEIVPLKPKDGFFVGDLAPVDAELAAAGLIEHDSSYVRARSFPRTITVAGDALEQGVGTTTWSTLDKAVKPPPLALLLDGRADAEATETSRAWGARRAAIYVVAAAALAEVLLLAARGRRAQAALEAHLALAGGDGADATEALRAVDSRARYWSLASLALVAFSFGVFAALLAFSR